MSHPPISHEAFHQMGDKLLTQLAEARSLRGDKLTLTDVEAILGGIIDSLQHSFESFENRRQQEIKDILSHLTQTRAELTSLGAPGINKSKLADANTSLDDAIKATEDAANAILDAADQLSALAAGLPAEQSQAAMQHITTIYEACNFQDLTGQRIRNVIKVLDYVESRLTAISGDADEEPVSFEQSLMNGPQSQTAAPNQDDIDALFNQTPPSS